MLKLVSINIVNWNGLHFLSNCVDSIKLQTYKNIEINIIDNNSSDDSCDFLSRKYPEIKIIKNNENAGFSRAHNHGIRVSLGEYILILNFDIVLDYNFVEEMVKSMESFADIGVVSGKLYMLKNGEKTHIIDSTGISMSVMFPSDRGQNEFDIGQYDMSYRIFGASGAAFLLRRNMLEDIKFDNEYFDEDFCIYVEDVDLCWRAQLYGWQARYNPLAIAYHCRGGTRMGNQDLIKKYFIIGYRNRYWAIIKNIILLSLFKNIIWIIIKEVGFYMHNILRKNNFVLSVPVIALKGLPRMLRKRVLIQKRKIVRSNYMDDFFFDDNSGSIKTIRKRLKIIINLK